MAFERNVGGTDRIARAVGGVGLLAEYRPPASEWIDDAVEAHDQFWSIEG